MPKTTKRPDQAEKLKCPYSSRPWECRHQRDRSELVAYVDATDNWETVATVSATAGASAEAMAQFICGLINNNQKSRSLLLEAMEALELCLEEDGLTFSSEQAADRVVANIKKSI